MGKYKNRKFPRDFAKVAEWLRTQKGVVVNLGTTTEFAGHFTREVTIHHNFELTKNGLFALLHECGHVLQPPTHTGINSYKNLDPKQYPDKVRMGRFLREVDAWDRGLQLANDLGIHIDKKQWDKERDESLLTYFK